MTAYQVKDIPANSLMVLIICDDVAFENAPLCLLSHMEGELHEFERMTGQMAGAMYLHCSNCLLICIG